VKIEVDMAVWKVSYVVKGSAQAGGIVNLNHAPEPGEVIKIGSDHFEVIEALELIPPRGEFHYIHATCKVIEPKE
jgi:hypothetical protein